MNTLGKKKKKKKKKSNAISGDPDFSWQRIQDEENRIGIQKMEVDSIDNEQVSVGETHHGMSANRYTNMDAGFHNSIDFGSNIGKNFQNKNSQLIQSVEVPFNSNLTNSRANAYGTNIKTSPRDGFLAY